jgi:microcompartment protein CcmL/EutN
MTSARDPAVALIEFSSIAAGIVAGDAMVKASPVGSIYAGTVHPGKYLVLVSGDTAGVEEAYAKGMEVESGSVLDSVFLADVHPAVVDAMTADHESASVTGDAIGIIEANRVATIIAAADAGRKAAFVELSAIRMADGLGGKAYLLFAGDVAEVEAAVETSVERIAGGHPLESRIIPRFHREMAQNLASDLRFGQRLVLRPVEREGSR